jgi:hypothetical protein
LKVPSRLLFYAEFIYEHPQGCKQNHIILII